MRDGSLEVDRRLVRVVPLSSIVQEYISRLIAKSADELLQSLVLTDDITNSESARLITLGDDPSNLMVGKDFALTIVDKVAFEHLPRKLHRVTAK